MRVPWRGLYRSLGWEEKAGFARLSGFEPHPAQLEVLRDRSRFKTLCCGRRWGKSRLAGFEGMVVSAMGGLVWAAAPTYDLARIVFDNIVAEFESPGMRPMVRRLSPGKGLLETVTGGTVSIRSSDSPESFLGRSPDLVIFDEAAIEPDGAIVGQRIRPALMDSEGGMVAISTPRGFNWFKDLYDLGDPLLPGRRPDYRSWTNPSWTNPYLKASELEAIIAETTEVMIQQEIEARFLAPAGSVFRKVIEAATGAWGELPEPGGRYVIGVDVAIVQDWTFIVVLDCEEQRVVWCDRFNQIDNPLIADRVAEASERFLAPVIVDITNNDGIGSMLKERIWWADVHPFRFSQVNKPQIVNTLALMLERGELVLPRRDAHPVANQLIEELLIYAYAKTPSGNIRTSAPSGKHDDGPMALALAVEMARRSGTAAPSVAGALRREWPVMTGRWGRGGESRGWLGSG